jgi:phenylpropionate dioxygenase-like ring-hydroxylating dioxygenase large terminal subunit
MFPDVLAIFFPDHAIVMRVIPLAVDRSVLEQTWYVSGEAVEGVDYDLDTLTEVQVGATDEDVPLISGTFAGTKSSAFEPGPYNLEQEPVLRNFYDWYRSRVWNGSSPVSVNVE